MASSESALADAIMDFPPSTANSNPAARKSNLAILQIALAEALKAKGAAIRELEAIRGGGQGTNGSAEVAAEAEPASDSTKCYFLDLLPLELRNTVYSNLLVKDILSERDSIPAVIFNGTPSPPSIKYDLSPNVLRACQQIYNEASAVLYRNNTFIFDFQRSYRWFSPLNRQFISVRPTQSQQVALAECGADAKTLGSHPLLRKIRHWKVIIGTDSHYEEAVPPCQHIFALSQILDKVQPQTVKVVVAPWNTDRNNTTFGPPYQHPSLRSVLRPFRNLRNLSGFELVHGTEKDLVYTTPPPPSLLGGLGTAPSQHPYRKHKHVEKLKLELETLVRSNEPVSSIFKIYQNLVRYAQAFERNERYKSEMLPGYEEILQRIRLVQGDLRLGASGPIPDPFPSDVEVLKEVSFRLRSSSTDYIFQAGSLRSPHGHKSPFKTYNFHPVERALEEASYAWERNKMDLLKEARCNVINYLEPQYQRLSAASLAFNQFVKEAKCPGGILDPENLGYLAANATAKCNADRALLDLKAEKYAQCFHRDIPEPMEIVFRLRRTEFRYAYSQLPRELLLTKLNELFEIRAPYLEVIETFKKVADDMDSQYLEIWNARKALFEHDASADYGVDIDLDLNRYEEMVDWTVTEPNIFIQEEPVAAPAPLPTNAANPANLTAQMNNAFQTFMNNLMPVVALPTANPNPAPPNGPMAQGNAPVTAAPNATGGNPLAQFPILNLPPISVPIPGGTMVLTGIGPPIPVQIGNFAIAASNAPAPNITAPAQVSPPVQAGYVNTSTATPTTSAGNSGATAGTSADTAGEEDEWIDSEDSEAESGADMEFET